MLVQDEMWMLGLAAVATCGSLGLILSLLSKPQDNHHKGSGDRKGRSATTLVLAFMGTPVAWILSMKPGYLPSLFLVVGSLLIGLGAWDWSLK